MRAIPPFWTACIVLGLLLTAPGCSDGLEDADYLQEQALDERIAAQAEQVPETLNLLRQEGVAATDAIGLEFYFYTDDEAKAAGLVQALEALSYTVETREAPGPSSLHMVSGTTTPMRTDQATVIAWTEQMCRLGHDHDCGFDGWTVMLGD